MRAFGEVIKINRATINLDIDAFNLLNVGTILGRELDLGLGTGDRCSGDHEPPDRSFRRADGF